MKYLFDCSSSENKMTEAGSNVQGGGHGNPHGNPLGNSNDNPNGNPHGNPSGNQHGNLYGNSKNNSHGNHHGNPDGNPGSNQDGNSSGGQQSNASGAGTGGTEAADQAMHGTLDESTEAGKQSGRTRHGPLLPDTVVGKSVSHCSRIYSQLDCLSALLCVRHLDVHFFVLVLNV